MTQTMDANLKAIKRNIRILDDAKYGSISEKRMKGYQSLLDSVTKRYGQKNTEQANLFILDEFQAMLCYMRGDNEGANRNLAQAMTRKGEDRKFVSRAAREWEVDYRNMLSQSRTQEVSSVDNEQMTGRDHRARRSDISTYKKANDYSWVGWLLGIGIFVLMIFTLGGSSDTESNQTQEDNGVIINRFVNEIDSGYSDLVDSTQRLAQDIDEECVWLSDNISEEVGDYCGDVANNNYAFLQDGDWDISELSYSETNELNETLDDIARQANEAYDNLLKIAEETEDAMNQQCSWLEDNISYNVGEGCFSSINGLGDFSYSPFSASSHYVDE